MLGHGRSFAGIAYSNMVRAARFSSSEFIVQRSKYKGQLSEMRKGWMEEIAKRNELKQQQIREERDRMVREKAVRLRQHRQESLLRQEQDRKLKAAALARFRAKLARNHLVWEGRVGVQQYRFKRLADDLKKESAVWITKDTVNSQITTDLFDKPASTGYHTRYSDLWRVNATSYNYELARVLYPEQFLQREDTKTAADRLQESFAQRSFYRRQEIEAFLAPMVKTGEDRRRLPELVDEFLTIMKDQDPEYNLLQDRLDLTEELDRQELATDLRLSEDPEYSPEAQDLNNKELRYNEHKKHFDVYYSDLSDTSESESDSEGLSGDEGEGEGDDDHDAVLSDTLIDRFDEKFPADPATRDAAIVLRTADDQLHHVQPANIRWDYAKATYNVSTMHDLRRALYVYRRMYGVNLLREDAELSDMSGQLGTLVESDVSDDEDGGDMLMAGLGDDNKLNPKLAFDLAGASTDGDADEEVAFDSDLEEDLDSDEESGSDSDSEREDGSGSDEEDPRAGDVLDLELAVGQELIRRGVLTGGPRGVRELLKGMDLPPEFDEPDKDMFGQVISTANSGAPVHRRGYGRDRRHAEDATDSEAEAEAEADDAAAARGATGTTASTRANKGTTAANKATPKAAADGFFDQGELPAGDKKSRP